MMSGCGHGYEHETDCPTCGPEIRERDAWMKPQGTTVRPRNRAERLALEAFLRRHPGMRAPNGDR